MSRPGKPAVLALVALAGAFACWAVLGQDRQHPEAARMSALFEQARPHLEELLNNRLPHKPVFRVVTPGHLGQTADPDGDAFVHWQFPHLRGTGLLPSLRATRAVLGPARLAHHVEGSDIIEVLPAPVMEAEPDFRQLAVVHEAVRQVLDRRHDVTRRRQCSDAEEFRAWHALVEGRAQWLTRQVARRLGREGDLARWNDSLLRVPDDDLDPALRLVTQAALRQLHWARVQGETFVRHLEEKGIDEAGAFARPPRLVKWIEQPELYVRAGNQPELATVLTRLEQALPAPEWLAAQQTFTPAMVAQVAALVGDRERANKLLAGWQEGRSLVWAKKNNPGQQVALSLVRFESAAAARSYFAFALDLQRKHDALSNNPSCGIPIKVVESRVVPMAVAVLEEGARTDRKVQVPGASALVPTATFLGRTREHVVEITWHGLAAESAWTERVISEALRD